MQLEWYWSTNGIVHYVRKGRYICNQAVAINRFGRIMSDLVTDDKICKNCQKHFNEDGTWKK